MNGRRRMSVDELWMNLYHLRLTIPQKVSVIEIPMSNGDWVRCFYPEEAPQPDVKCVLYRTWMSQLRQLMMTVGAQRFISKAPHLHNEATWSNTTQHNISAAAWAWECKWTRPWEPRSATIVLSSLTDRCSLHWLLCLHASPHQQHLF